MVCSLSSKFKWIQENRNESRQSTRNRHTIKPQIDKSIPNSRNSNFIHSALHSDSVEQLCTAYNSFRVISLECPSMEFSFSLFSSTSNQKSVIFGYFSSHTQKKHRAVGKEWSTMCKQAIAAVVFIESPNGSSHSVQWLYNFKESVCNRRRNTREIKQQTNTHTGTLSDPGSTRDSSKPLWPKFWIDKMNSLSEQVQTLQVQLFPVCTLPDRGTQCPTHTNTRTHSECYSQVQSITARTNILFLFFIQRGDYS